MTKSGRTIFLLWWLIVLTHTGIVVAILVQSGGYSPAAVTGILMLAGGRSIQKWVEREAAESDARVRGEQPDA